MPCIYACHVIESAHNYFHHICEETDAFLVRTFESMFRPFAGPLESLGWGFRIATNSVVDILFFGFNLIRTIAIFLFDVTYFLVWLVGFCSSFIVFKFPAKLKSIFFTILELLDMALGLTVEFCSQTSDWTFWLVNFWLPKIWEEHWWKAVKVSISFLTLFYTLVRED